MQFTGKYDFWGEFHEKPIYRGDYLKRGGLDSLQIQGGRGGGVGKKEGGGVFEGKGEVDAPMHTIMAACDNIQIFVIFFRVLITQTFSLFFIYCKELNEK